MFVHAVGEALAATFPHPAAANGVVFPNSIGAAVGGLIATGALERHPRLRLLASHGGGSLRTVLPRLAFMRSTTPELRELMPQEPAAYARRLWFDPLLFDATLLGALVDVVGADRIGYGTDFPFMLADPVAYLDGPGVDPALAAAIRTANPRRLLDELA